MTNNKILLCEDNKKDELLTLRALESVNLGNEVFVARDGQEAVEYLFPSDGSEPRPESDLPLVVLLDLRMPRLDGFQVLKRIRDHPRTKNLAVVVLTSSDEEKDIVRSYELGANSYVRKPVEFEEFGKAITDLGLYWVITNEPMPRTGA